MLRRRAASPRRPRGISLIEISITLVIAALLMMAVAPDVIDWMRNLKIRSTAESLQSGLQHARQEAMRRNQNVSFWLVTSAASGALDATCALTDEGGSWVVSVNDPTGKCDVAVSDSVDPQIVDKRGLGNAVGAVAVEALAGAADAPAQCLTFNGFGRVALPGCAADQLTTITVDSRTPGEDYRPLRIEITGGGGIRLCDTRIAAADDPRKCQLQLAP